MYLLLATIACINIRVRSRNNRSTEYTRMEWLVRLTWHTLYEHATSTLQARIWVLSLCQSTWAGSMLSSYSYRQRSTTLYEMGG